MTNEVTTGGSPQLPAFLQAHLQQNKPSADVASLATAQNSTPRLSLRGKVFRFMNGQEEVKKSRDPVKVFIVGVEPGPGKFTKTFYKDPYAGNDSAGSPPDCSSADGVVPDPWIQAPVSPQCGNCPKNMFGSATSRRGKPSKACHDSKRLMIALDSDPMGTLFLSQIPVTSLKPLASYGTELAGMGVETWMVVTELSMDDEAEFPELRFKHVGFIDESMMTDMKARAEKREWAQNRQLMIGNGQPQRPALPPHLQQVLGGTGGSPAAAATTSNLAPSVAPGAAAAAEQVIAQPGGPAQSGDLLSQWGGKS